jgi:hypothetical protein
MRQVSRWAAFLVAIVCVLPLVAADAPPKAKKDADKHLNTPKSLSAGQMTGKIVAVVESKRSLRVQINLQVPVMNPGALVGLQQAQIQMAQARSWQSRMAAQQNMMQNQAVLYSMKNYSRDVELQTTEDVVVRMANPPPKYDDKGKVQKYTQKELRALRGDSKEPGYPAVFSDLTVDQVVTLTLVKKKADAAARKPARPKGKEVDPDALLDSLPQVSMVYIVVDPSTNTAK